MLPDIQLLTIPISTTGCYKPLKLSTTNLFNDFGNIPARTIENISVSDYMANSSPRSNRSQEENELWFSMSASLNVSLSHCRQGTPQNLSPEQSAYRSTSNRINLGSGTSRSTSQLPSGPPSSNLNKPLPPSPSEVGKTNRNSWRGLLHRESPPSKPTHLRPEPYPERGSSLSLNTQTQYHHGHSRSMPSSPFSYEQSHLQQPPVALPRAQSSMGDYSDASQYQPYLLPCQNQSSFNAGGRSTSMNTYFDPTIPPRSRTFPETTISPIAREDASHRPRPHTTWLSPTEPFNDISQFHLFAEAMTGLPNDSDPFSPTGPPQLQGSLFARRNRNDTIPIPLQQSVQSTSFRSTRPSVRDDWQNFEPPPSVSISQHAAPPSNSPYPQPQSQQQWQPPPHMAGINRELELLGLDEEHGSDDELPNYAQSQAEANEKRRAEASARARELEARWRGTRR